MRIEYKIVVDIEQSKLYENETVKVRMAVIGDDKKQYEVMGNKMLLRGVREEVAVQLDSMLRGVENEIDDKLESL